jgi:hypothetical protein
MQDTTAQVNQGAALKEGDPVIEPGHTYGSITDKISDIVLVRPTGLGWLRIFGFSSMVAGMLGISLAILFYKGVGIWGINQPVGWGFDIINFVWWIGIGHAGTLISAILLLLKQIGAPPSTASPKR